MRDPVHAGERTGRQLVVADVAHDQLDTVGDVRIGASMHLLLQRVEDDDLVAVGRRPRDSSR